MTYFLSDPLHIGDDSDWVSASLPAVGLKNIWFLSPVYRPPHIDGETSTLNIKWLIGAVTVDPVDPCLQMCLSV